MSTLATLSSTPATMTSRDVAELTGKRHSDVLRDIDNLLESLNEELRSGFKSSTYKDSTGKGNRMFIMDRDSTYCLVAGYDANARMRIIKRWQELEEQTSAQPPKLSREERYRLGVYRDAVKTARMMGFNENMALLSADNYCKNTLGIGVLAHMGATHLLADPRGKVYTPTELGQLVNPPMSAVKFNLALEAAGLQRKEMGTWMPCDAAEGLFEWADTGKKHSLGTPVKQLRWFKDVLGRLPSEMVTTH